MVVVVVALLGDLWYVCWATNLGDGLFFLGSSGEVQTLSYPDPKPLFRRFRDFLVALSSDRALW